jgi:hypothetical protein
LDCLEQMRGRLPFEKNLGHLPFSKFLSFFFIFHLVGSK